MEVMPDDDMQNDNLREFYDILGESDSRDVRTDMLLLLKICAHNEMNNEEETKRVYSVLNGSRGVFRSGVGNVFIKELHDRILDHRYIENIKKNNDLNDLTVVRSLVKSISGDNVLKSRVGKSFLQQLISLEEELEIIYLIRTNFDLEDEAVVHDILLVVSEPGREVFVTETGRQFVDYLENKAGKAYIGNDNNKGIRMIPVIAALFLVAGISFGIAGKYIIDDIHYGNVAKELADSVGGGHSEDLNIRESANNPGQDILAGMEPGKRASLILDGNAGILEEYEELASKNADMAGWLTVEGTDINYPVLHRSDNSFYLDHNFYGEHDRNGSLFIDRYCSIFPQSENIIIYGHNVDNAPSFGQIKFFKDKPFRNYHPYITFNTIYEKGKYEIVSVFTTSVEKQGFQYYLFYGYDNEEQFNEFADYIMANAEYDTGVECHYGDKFLTLSTCDNSVSDGRFVVVAKKVE